MLQVRQRHPISLYLKKGIISCFVILCIFAIFFNGCPCAHPLLGFGFLRTGKRTGVRHNAIDSIELDSLRLITIITDEDDVAFRLTFICIEDEN